MARVAVEGGFRVAGHFFAGEALGALSKFRIGEGVTVQHGRTSLSPAQRKRRRPPARTIR